VIVDGLLGIRLEPDGLGKLEIAGIRTDSGDSTWNPVWGDVSEVRDHFNELTVMLREIDGGRIFHIVLRAYNQGVACRYHLPEQPHLKECVLRGSLTEFRFLDDHVVYQNRYLVDNLNPPCAIQDTSWIVPGKAISQVRNARLVHDQIQALIDWASAHGIEYVEIDHSWYGPETKWTPEEIAGFEKNKGPFWDDKHAWRKNVGGDPFTEAKGYVPFRPHSYQGGTLVDLDLRKLAAYSRTLDPPVGIAVYLRGELLEEFGGEHPVEQVFAAYAEMGLAGVRPGFVPPASQPYETAIARMVACAARHKLQLNIHDAYYPSGLSRTYPNLVNVEGVAGDEAEHRIPVPTKCLHDVMLPFTRALMGPLDYTPEIGRQSKSHCHQVAMIGIFPGRVTIRGGTRQWAPGGEGGDELEFVVALPSLFDELKVFTDLGKYVTFARRKGKTWYVASMSGPDAVTHELPLDFLNPGERYQAAIYSDVPGQRRSQKHEREVDSQTSVAIVMEPCGGGLLILNPKP
jgi:alpha-glucosidase